MSTINTPSASKTTAGSSSSRVTPPPQPRKDGLTPQQALDQQQRMLNEFYIDDTASNHDLHTSPPVSPKTAAPKRGKMNRFKLPAATDNVDDAPSPLQKIKPASKRTMAGSSASSEMDSTPTRRSERNKNKKRSAPADDDHEPESPLAKKSKTTISGSTVTTAKAGLYALKYNNVAPISKKKAGKLPVTAAERPVSTRPTSFMKQLRSKLPKTHTPSSELAKQKATSGNPATADGDGENENENDDVVADDETGGKKSAKGKGMKAEKKVVIPHDFVGEETGMGTSANRPEIAPGTGLTLLDKPWPCANRQCNTGMTWLLRDGQTATDGFGRKTGSQFYGRNKAETRLMDNDVWHTYCRKCYQRGYYALTNQKKDGETFHNRPQEGAAFWHMGNLRAQFLRLKLWRPEATFKVQLTKNMHARSNAWHATLRSNEDDAETAAEAYAKHPKFGFKERKPAKNGEVAAPKPEEAFPVQLVDSFTRDACGEDYDYDRVTEVLDHIQGMLDTDTIKQVPPIEFLISLPVDGEDITDPANNYKRWTAATDTRVFQSSAPTSGDEEGAEDGTVAESGNVKAESDAGEDVEDEQEDLYNVSRKATPTVAETQAGSDFLDHFEKTSDDEESSSDSESEYENEHDERSASLPPATGHFTSVNSRHAQSSPAPPPKQKDLDRDRFKMRPTASNPSGRPLSTTYGATPGSGMKHAREMNAKQVEAGSSNSGKKRARDDEEVDGEAGPADKRIRV
ncbi:hypothetical protein LTR36_010473 [Oleoguttula mirabilis]|uniref:Uncharacterized protein n=1 Tax=Oleoguttula mirabilis TaxID=1507867 RepID=A0AAV9J433_9PEZI|nr:hypothetical protein LTR36_010473 [Oleoguttula mirabilis]